MSGRPMDDLLKNPIHTDDLKGMVYVLAHVVTEAARRTGTADQMLAVLSEMSQAEFNSDQARDDPYCHKPETRHWRGRSSILAQLHNLLQGTGASYAKTPTGEVVK